MRNRVEVGREVGVEHLRVAPGEVGADLLHGLVGVLLRAEAVGARLEVRLEDGLQDQAGRGLDHPVPHGGDAEGPLAATPLGDQHTPDGVGPVGVRSGVPRPDARGTDRPRPPLRRRWSPHRPRGAPVRPHQGPGVTQDIRPVDLVVEEVEPEGGLRLGLAVELPLESPHRLRRLEPHGNPPRVSR